MLKRTACVLLVAAALPLSIHAQVRVGPEFRVNSYTTFDQARSRVAMDASGRFLVVWESQGQDGSGLGVFARWYEPDGEPIDATEFRVNAATADQQRQPEVAAAPDGQMVVTWMSGDGSNYSVFARHYPSATGSPGPEFLVDESTTDLQGYPSVAADGAGNFVVVWDGFGLVSGVLGRQFDAAGLPRGGTFRLDSYTTHAGRYPVVASDADGNFVAVWEMPDGSRDGIFAQRYDSGGVRVGGEFRINTYTTGQQGFPDVASDVDGNFVVVWQGEQDDDDDDVWGRRYDAAGLPKGEPFLVSLYTTGNQSRPAVAMHPDGGFVAAWGAVGSDGSGTNIQARFFDAAGTPDPVEFRLNSYTTRAQSSPALAADAQGTFVATWNSSEQDGSHSGIFAQRFRSDLILRDGFEDGTLGAWSSSATDGADLSVSTLAGLKLTGAGLRGTVDDTAGLYVQDDRPRDERRYRARFYFDPNGFDPGEAQSHRRTRIFLAFSEAPTRRVAAVVLRRLDGQYAIRARARLDDDRQAETAFIPVTDGPHVIEFELRRASFPLASDGQLTVTVDGLTVAALSLDNDLANVDFVRMGALSVKAGANGTMYWDEFESRRQGAIGP